jgi:predicted esterase
VFRRGFLSAVDSTYRPYSVRVPGHFDPGRRYPLMVYLHGSGQDDRGVLERLPDYGGEMIIVAPNGRGTSNCYTTGNSQEDIAEALKDAVMNYPVDTGRIILAGFSMGGYGVYRTFYEHPSSYCLLAVFSGSPGLGNRWIGEDQPDFNADRYLAPFAGRRIFIYHGTADLNLPADETVKFVEKLDKAGAVVTFVTEAKGHESPGEATVERFREWIKINL